MFWLIAEVMGSVPRSDLSMTLVGRDKQNEANPEIFFFQIGKGAIW